MKTGSCYWRLNGEKYYKYGYVTHVNGNLYRMGLWNGDKQHGKIIDEKDIEVKS